MNTTTYSYAAPRKPVAKSVGPFCVFAVFYNGVPFVHPLFGWAVEHGSIDAAWKAIFRAAGEFHTAIGCFGVQRIDLW